MSLPDINDKTNDKDPLNSDSKLIHLQKKILDHYDFNEKEALRFAIKTWNMTVNMIHDSLPKENVTYNAQLSIFRNFLLDYIQKIVSAGHLAEKQDMIQKGWFDPGASASGSGSKQND